MGNHGPFSFASTKGLWILGSLLVGLSLMVTQRYAHLSTKDMQEAADTVGDIISEAMAKSR